MGFIRLKKNNDHDKKLFKDGNSEHDEK